MKKVEIYGADWCPVCEKAKRFATEYPGVFEVEYHELDTDNEEEVDALKARVAPAVLRTIPQIFVEDDHIGGYSEFKEYVDNNKE